MQAVLGAELRDRLLAPDRLECYFRFEFSVITLACRLGHLNSSFPKDEPSLSYCPILRDPLFALNRLQVFLSQSPSASRPNSILDPRRLANVSHLELGLA